MRQIPLRISSMSLRALRMVDVTLPIVAPIVGLYRSTNVTEFDLGYR